MSSSASPSELKVDSTLGRLQCVNCRAQLAADAVYCHRCGQETTQHAPTLWEFIHEFTTHYVALEGALWRTLKALIFRPGFLTVEYLAGVRRRYVLPLKLLLSLSFIYFLLVRIDFNSTSETTAPKVGSSAIVEQIDSEADRAVAQNENPTAVPGIMIGNRVIEWHPLNLVPHLEPLIRSLPDSIEPTFQTAYAQWNKNPQEQYQRAKTKFREMMPLAVLCSLPFFAGILSMVLYRRRVNFGAHFVFAMHFHAFIYLMLPLFALATLLSAIYADWVVLLWWLIYPVLAIKQVYGAGWISTLLSSAAIFLLHVTLILMMLSSVFILALLSA